jgi:hypothetical protein
MLLSRRPATRRWLEQLGPLASERMIRGEASARRDDDQLVAAHGAEHDAGSHRLWLWPDRHHVL